jgi:ABC-type nitrate/sulfonate/bicarbonate transport system ATPase subunit
VARAFAVRPRLLLLDEPFGSLDSLTRFELQDVLSELCRRTHTTAVLVTHDVDEALYLSDRIAMMTDGPAATIGDVLEVPFARPRSRNDLIGTAAYDQLRDRMLEFLAHTSAHRDTAARV